MSNQGVEYEVVVTRYEMSRSKKGNPMMVVDYVTPHGSFREWVMDWSLQGWWKKHSKYPCPPNIEEACEMAKVGKVWPKGKVIVEMNDGRQNVIGIETRPFDPKIAQFMKEVQECIGEVTVLSVIS